MCRVTDDFNNHVYQYNHHLKLTTFTLNLSLSSSQSSSLQSTYIPEILTLVFLPRVSGHRIEINDSKVRLESPAFVTLHRTVSSTYKNVVTFACKDRIVVFNGVAFEVHVGDVTVLKGEFREIVERGKDEGVKWGLKCKCMMVKKIFIGVKKIEVCVNSEDHLSHLMSNHIMSIGIEGPHTVDETLIRQKVKFKNRRRRRKEFKMGLESIPEGIEGDVEGEPDDEAAEDGGGVECEVEEVNWADLGILVACLGMGFLATRASYKALFRRKLLV